jgi:hypothetical protein
MSHSVHWWCGIQCGPNDQFYGKVTTTLSVVNGDVAMPTDRPTLIQNVYDKLAKLAEGATYTPSNDDVKQKQEAAKVAQKASDEVARSDPNVQKVDAAAEAAKEKAIS